MAEPFLVGNLTEMKLFLDALNIYFLKTHKQDCSPSILWCEPMPKWQIKSQAILILLSDETKKFHGHMLSKFSTT